MVDDDDFSVSIGGVGGVVTYSVDADVEDNVEVALSGYDVDVCCRYHVVLDVLA
jgi:hypothetical protein